MDEKSTTRSEASHYNVLSNEGQALVLSGGGARAAYQVGCLQPWREACRTIGHKF